MAPTHTNRGSTNPTRQGPSDTFQEQKSHSGGMMAGNGQNFRQVTISSAGNYTNGQPANDTSAKDALADRVDHTMAAIDDIMRRGVYAPQLCPWHTQQVMGANAPKTGLSPMERYMAETEIEQSAIYCRNQDGTLSLSKGCTCGAAFSAVMSSTSNISSGEENHYG